MTPVPTEKTRERVAYIRQRMDEGARNVDIAKELGLDPKYVASLKSTYVAMAPAQIEKLYRRWMDEHDILGIAERALKA